MVEMPNGISTSNGNWYNTTQGQIENYIPGLLKKVSLEEIIKNADNWVSSTNGMALILYLVLALAGGDPRVSFLISVVFFFFWYINTSAFVTPVLNQAMRLFNFDGFVYLSAAGVLIYFSLNDNQLGTWLGLGLFFLFKVGLLSLGLKWFSSKSAKPTFTREDRILNMLLIKYGMKEGMYSGGIQEMQDSLFKTINYHKTRKKK